MKNPKVGRKILWIAGVVIIVASIKVVSLVLSPITMCITFDDDQNAHASIAGPTLEKYGWRGAFNIVTGRLEHPRAIGKMSWAQAQRLLEHGHEIYPHSLFPDPSTTTFSHYNLRTLAENGDLGEVEKQVLGSKKMIEEKLGVTPIYFCLPFNAMNEDVERIIRKSDMCPMNCKRRNFPTHPGLTPMSISDYIKSEWRKGNSHVDIMIHGIVRTEGGWEPFEDADHFEAFCKELKTQEIEGNVRVLKYSEYHKSEPMYVSILFRKAVFRLLCFLGII